MNDPFEHVDDLTALARADEPSPEDLRRLEERVRRDLSAPPSRSRRWWALGVAVAAAATLVVVAGLPSAPAELGVGRSELARGVVVAAAGAGSWSGQGDATEVLWTDGRIAVEVDPAVHAQVSVRTDEALVKVRGTVFDVERGPFGTRVGVSRGRVEVTCAAGASAPVLIDAGGERWCLRDAAAGLGRVLRLEAEAAPPERRLEAIELALGHPAGSDDVRATLRARRTSLLVELAGKHLGSGDCVGAEPWLALLEADGDADAAQARRRCAGSAP